MNAITVGTFPVQLSGPSWLPTALMCAVVLIVGVLALCIAREARAERIALARRASQRRASQCVALRVTPPMVVRRSLS